MHECLASSLIPRLFPPPVFDCLQCAKTEGKGLGEIVMCMMSCRHEGGKPGIDQPRIYRITSCNDAVFRTLQSQVFGRDITRRTSRFFVGHHPPHIYPPIYSTLMSTWHHAHDSFSQAFPSVFAYCKQSKLEAGTPGNKVTGPRPVRMMYNWTLLTTHR